MGSCAHLMAFQKGFTLDWSGLVLWTEHWCVCRCEARSLVGFFSERASVLASLHDGKQNA